MEENEAPAQWRKPPATATPYHLLPSRLSSTLLTDTIIGWFNNISVGFLWGLYTKVPKRLPVGVDNPGTFL